MGPISARKRAEAALGLTSGSAPGRKPDGIFVIGLCGGLSANLSEGKIVAYAECLSTDTTNPRMTCSTDFMGTVTALLASSDISCDRVVGITSPRFATTRMQKLALAKKSGATVVDMESYSILNAAASAGIPAAVLRVVSDSVDREFPDFNRALNDAGALDGRKALKVALASPVKTAKLLAANRRAMRHLTKALEVVLNADYVA